MATKIQALLESDETQAFFAENEELLAEVEIAAHDFRKVLKAFVLQNPQEFIAESVEETKKNIRVFSEIATAQFFTEVSAICGSSLAEEQVVAESALGDYL